MSQSVQTIYEVDYYGTFLRTYEEKVAKEFVSTKGIDQKDIKTRNFIIVGLDCYELKSPDPVKMDFTGIRLN